MRNTGRTSRRTLGKRVPVSVQLAWSTRCSTRPQHCVRNEYRDEGPNSPVPEGDQRHPIHKGVGLELVTVAKAVAATTCRKPVAPRRQGSRVPFHRTQVASRVPPFAGRFLGRRPFVSHGRFLGRRPFRSFHHCPVPGVPTDPQSPKEVVSGAGSHEGCPHHGFWASPNGGVVSAVIPCPHERWR